MMAGIILVRYHVFVNGDGGGDGGVMVVIIMMVMMMVVMVLFLAGSPGKQFRTVRAIIIQYQ
jgi:hypothetical protein